VPVLYTA
ncbi:3-Oxoacyl-[acyl-carrier-(ACP)] synthase III family protein, partial [Vibrio parahaemolyticus V-223/04]